MSEEKYNPKSISIEKQVREDSARVKLIVSMSESLLGVLQGPSLNSERRPWLKKWKKNAIQEFTEFLGILGSELSSLPSLLNQQHWFIDVCTAIRAGEGKGPGDSLEPHTAACFHDAAVALCRDLLRSVVRAVLDEDDISFLATRTSEVTDEKENCPIVEIPSNTTPKMLLLMERLPERFSEIMGTVTKARFEVLAHDCEDVFRRLEAELAKTIIISDEFFDVTKIGPAKKERLARKRNEFVYHERFKQDENGDWCPRQCAPARREPSQQKRSRRAGDGHFHHAVSDLQEAPHQRLRLSQRPPTNLRPGSRGTPPKLASGAKQSNRPPPASGFSGSTNSKTGRRVSFRYRSKVWPDRSVG